MPKPARAQITFSLGRFLAIYPLLVLGCLGVVIATVLYYSIDKSATTIQHTIATAELDTTAESLQLFLQNHQTVLQDLASTPLLTQSVMQPEQMGAQIADLMDAFQLIGRYYPLILTDFSGATLYSTQQVPEIDFTQAPWHKEIMSRQRDSFIGMRVVDTQHYLELAVPVIYNGYPEGVLVAEIPFQQASFNDSLHNNIGSNYLAIKHLDQVIAHYGEPVSGPPLSTRIDQLNLSLELYTDRSGVEQMRTLVLLHLGGILTLLTLAGALIVVLLANRFVVTPINRLRLMSAELAHSDQPFKVPVNQRIREIAALSRDFNTMGATIQQRQAQLKETNRSLKQQIQERIAAEKESAQMEVQLRHAQKLESVGQLAAGIAHEINTPAQFVGDNLRFLQQSMEELFALLERYDQVLDDSDEQKRQAIARINEEIERDYLLEEIPKALQESSSGMQRISRIVLAMKEFSHPGSRSKVPTDINKALDTTITVTRNEWKYAAELCTEFASNLPQVLCLPDEINQVFLNLIINAAQAISADRGENAASLGQIHISTELDGDQVLIRVRDDGCGIPAELRERIFDPFFTTKPPGQGTGQGLSIAYAIVVEQHAGQLSCSSEVGQGSTFTVALPIAPEDSPSEQVS